MMQDYDGADVFDAEGNKIGHVERTYVDGSRTPTYAEVKMGTLFAKHRLVPLQNAEPQGDGIHLPLSKAVVENSPDVSGLGDGVAADTLSEIDAYYGMGVGPSGDSADADTDDGDDGADDSDTVPSAQTVPATQQDETAGESARNGIPTADPVSANANGQDPTAVRDLGDVIEVPIVEEEIVKRPVVKEVVRVRKTQTTETQTAEGDVRREDVVPVDGSEDGDETDTRSGSVLDRIKSKFEGATLPGEDVPTDPMGGQTYRESGAPVSAATTADTTDE